MALPDAFKDLEGFEAGWALPTEPARMRKRETSSMDEIKSFYDAMIGRLPSIAAHLNTHPIDALPERERRLLDMALMLIEASFAIERYNQPTVINGRERARFFPEES
jgi:hypothetical protein